MSSGELIRKITSKEALIGVVGLGYVGLPIVLRFCEEGFRVVGFDTDPRKVKMLMRGRSYIKHIESKRVRSFIKGSYFDATTEMAKLGEPDVIIICVPTPLTEKREPDMHYVRKTAEDISLRIRAGQLVSLESTTYPGTTEEILLPVFTEKGLKVGRDFFLVYSPEREDPGRTDYNTKTIPKVVGGVTPQCLEAGYHLYSQIVDRVFKVSSPQAAEMTKLLENIYRSVNISLVNELKLLCDRMGIDLWEVIEAAKTKPFGFQPFYPGPGLGGHCIPIDPFYLTWKAREYDFATRFIELAGEINLQMPAYVVRKVIDSLNEIKLPIKGAKVLILGVAYKKDVDDMRESPALKIIELLHEKGAKVDYHDPYIPSMTKTRKYDFRKKSVKLTEANIRKYDCVLIVTNHSSYDYDWIVKHAKLVVDSRNAVKRKNKKVVKA